MFTIRESRRADPDLVYLSEAGIKEGYGFMRTFRREMRDNAHRDTYFTAWADGTPVGVVVLRENRDGSYRLVHLYVDKKWRRGGVGTALVECLLARIPSGKTCTLAAAGSAVEFYQEQGFVLDESPEMHWTNDE